MTRDAMHRKPVFEGGVAAELKALTHYRTLLIRLTNTVPSPKKTIALAKTAR